jgi:cell division protein FtsN
MFDANKSSGELSSSYRRRVFSRENIPFRHNLFNIDLGQSKTGRVLNISEGGLAVRTIANSIDDYLPQIRFKFSRSEAWVETGGRVVWSNESRDVAGVEFTSLSDEGRDQIREWLAEVRSPDPKVTTEEALQPLYTTKSANSLVNAATQITADGEFHPTQLGALPERASAPLPEDAGWRRGEDLSGGRSRLLIGLFVGLLMTGIILFFLGRFVHKTQIDKQEPQGKTVAEATQLPIGKPANSELPMPATAVSKPAGPAKQVSGFVLQTGAMVHEENAKALADSLRQRNFPAFVAKSGSDHLYRVYVGPYPDHHSAVNIDTELVQQGFAAILKSWSPPSRAEYRSAIPRG